MLIGIHDWNTRRKMERVFRRSEDPYGYFSHPHEIGKYDLMEKMLSDRRYSRALEIGCAEGAFTSRLAALCDSVLAVDISSTAVARARQRLAKSKNVRFMRANVRELDVSPEWDLIVVSEVLYYLDKAVLPVDAFDRFLARLAALLAPDGRILVLHSFAGERQRMVRAGYVRRFLNGNDLRLTEEKIGGSNPQKSRYLISLLTKSELPVIPGPKEGINMHKTKRLMAAVLTATAVAVGAHDMSPKQEAQLKTVFPEAAGFVEQHVNLTNEQAAQVSAKLGHRSEIQAREVRLLGAKGADGGYLGHAVYFSIKDKDGDPIKGLVGLNLDETIKKVVIFSHDKADPVAHEGFLSQFAGKSTDPVQWGKAVKPAAGPAAASQAAAKAIHRAALLAEAAMSAMTDGRHDEGEAAMEKGSVDDAPSAAYQCPMKCSPAQNNPGRCPKCGMSLEKVKDEEHDDGHSGASDHGHKGHPH